MVGFGTLIVWVFLIAVVAFLYRGSPDHPKNQKEPDIGIVSNPSPERVMGDNLGINVEPEKYLGIWVSDRSTKTLLELKDDGTFEDEIWMGTGKYIINGPYLMLDNESGQKFEKRVIRYEENKDGEPQLFFNIGQYTTVYHRGTEEEIQEIRSYIEKLKEENIYCGVDDRVPDPEDMMINGVPQLTP